MAQFLRLPSGFTINTEKVLHISKIIFPEGSSEDAFVRVCFNELSSESGGVESYSRIIEGKDAHALNAWFLKYSALIGEDGNEYAVLSDNRLSVLKRAAAGEVVMAGPYADNLFYDGLLEMQRDEHGLLVPTGDNGEIPYVISEAGRISLALQPK